MNDAFVIIIGISDLNFWTQEFAYYVTLNLNVPLA